MLVMSLLRRKTHILVECPELIPSVRVGVLEILQYIEREYGLCEVRFSRTFDIHSCDLEWSDIFISVRGCEEATWKLVTLARRYARYVVMFLDDDLLHLPSQKISEELYRDEIIRVYLPKILACSHKLWVVNRRLGETYGSLTRTPFFTSEVPIQLPKERRDKTDNSVFRVLYAGSVGHGSILKQCIAPSVPRLIKRFKDNIHFTFIGADPGLISSAQVSVIPFFEDYDTYRNYVNYKNFDLGLAPLEDSSFYSYKYYNKFLEYTQIGITGLYSSVPPYTDVIRDGENGFLCATSDSAWENAICRIAFLSSQVRQNCLANARQMMEERFSYACQAEHLLRNFPQIVNYRAPQHTIPPVQIVPLLHYWHRSWMYLKSDGIAAIPIIIQKAVKKYISGLRRKYS